MQYTGIFILFFTFVCTWESLEATNPVLPHVMHYDVVRPQALKERVRRSTSSLKTYPENLEYALSVDGRNLTISLHRNNDLLGEQYTLFHYTEDGISETTSSGNTDHCYYQGHIHDIEDSSVSVGLCSGMHGFLRTEKQVYLIEPLEESVDGNHAIFKQEHLRVKQGTFGYVNDTVYDLGPRFSGLYKGKNRKNKALIGGQQIVEMALVVDHEEYKKFGSVKKIEERMMLVANHVDKLYRPLNIRVRLVGIEIWTNKDMIMVSPNSDVTLKTFLQWRQDYLLKRKKHDNAHFITGIDFEGSTIGLATMYAMCSQSSGAVNQDHNVNPIALASTIAHEMGHNLGMSHDDQTCGCSVTNGCIMGETIGLVLPDAFSICSQAYLKRFLQNYDISCLLDMPNESEIYGGPVCGNAFVEKGEECDCGTVEPNQMGSLCRRSAHDCDLEEYCTGESAFCPKDDYRMNGLPCNYNQGYCYNGQCPTHKEHCKLLWGSDAEVDDDTCFHYNVIDRTSKSAEHIKCGKIYCAGGKEFPITQNKRKVTMRLRSCNMAVDPSPTEDLGMVPTGTKCGPNKAMKNAVIIGVATSVFIIGLVIVIIGVVMSCRNKKAALTQKRSLKDHCTSSGQCNPAFQPSSAKNSPKYTRPRIGRPDFLESSATVSCKPLFPQTVPSRPAPLVTTPNRPPLPPAKPTEKRQAYTPPQDLEYYSITNGQPLSEADEVNVADVVNMWSENVLCRFVLVVSCIDVNLLVTENLQIIDTMQTNPAIVKKTAKVSTTANIGPSVDPAFQLLLDDKEQAMLALQETVEILQMKVNKLEHLLHLKDLRIEDLTKHLERYKTRNINT
ncbi:Disintegrin and metalloproteinase domain-containing protein 8 [Triplophysa tibetana]|uniref:Disintegrin and metalloproteinase domain-containing protein 8 n=1 Tax=Triplophysa tibetana TaxID=1572043 RepID=A0A5A9PA91_9TELE|nr:Disintegrin and metalloproteinase domain-containing protein 8 [Triplophysa tibetana]